MHLVVYVHRSFKRVISLCFCADLQMFIEDALGLDPRVQQAGGTYIEVVNDGDAPPQNLVSRSSHMILTVRGRVPEDKRIFMARYEVIGAGMCFALHHQ